MIKKLIKQVIWILITVLVFLSCNQHTETEPTNKLFRQVASSESGINFSNTIIETEDFNLYTYNYIYDGSGVAVGDLNNDGLIDIYFTGNTSENKLYLNQGDFKFSDITQSAGVAGDARWMTGTTMADVNNDGYLDIYISVAGQSENRRNLLFVNNGDLTFTESAAEYGLDDNGASTQATFLDYDKDGDLDMYLVNRPIDFDISRNAFLAAKHVATDLDTDKLYSFEDGKFVDKTDEAGLRSYDYGQSVTVGDLNNDSWPDLYVSGDFQTPDFMYINNGDGTFTDQLESYTGHVSFSAMGTDINDFNNDGLLDIIELDMVAEDHVRKKTMMGAMAPEAFWETVNQGYHFQYMFNSLQMNNGNNTFSEIAKLSGIAETDWSWSPLLADLDDDGWKDLFVTNGIIKDVNDNDYNNTINKQAQLGVQLDFLQVNENMPSQELVNYAFQNNGDLTFSNKAEDWGLDLAGFSYGSAYADFDNDGDLDLVVQNMNSVAVLYQNQTSSKGNGYLNLKFEGIEDNKFGVGVKAEIKMGNQKQVNELTLTRGYLSSVAPEIHFGLGDAITVDQLLITWPNGTSEILNNVAPNQTLKLSQKNATKSLASGSVLPMMIEVSEEIGLNFRHIENDFNDYNKQVLLPYKLSKIGPGLTTGDVNGDGLADVFITGAQGQAGALYVQGLDGSFILSPSAIFNRDKDQEGTDALLFDADGDKDLDLYIVNGGNEQIKADVYYQDKLYFNDGHGKFTDNSNSLPELTISGSKVKASDIDGDGDLDLFVAGRHTPWEYPQPTSSIILLNDSGKFKNVTADVAPDLLNIGMITDAIWSDYDNDSDQDLVLVGEWMPMTILANIEGKFELVKTAKNLNKTTGWWSSIAEADLNNDGKMDYITGNLGLNYRYHANDHDPFLVYSADFDNNGSVDIVLGYDSPEHSYPIRGRQCSSQQSSFVLDKFPDYQSFANATMADIYGQEVLDNSYKKEVNSFLSTVWIQSDELDFNPIALPNHAQISSVNSILVMDFNKDEQLDLIISGNLYSSEEESPRNDASIGLLLAGDGQGAFEPVSPAESGFSTFKDVKDMALLPSIGCDLIITVSNGDTLDAHKLCLN